MKLEEALRLFVDSYANPNTRRAYEGVLEPFVSAIGPKRDVEIITPVDIQRYIADLTHRLVRYEGHSRRPAEAGALSDFTIRKHIKTIKTFFNWMVRLEILMRSPVRIQVQKVPIGVRQDRKATDEEVELILRACFGHTRNYALVLFLADTGCRAGGVATISADTRLHGTARLPCRWGCNPAA